MKTAAVVGLLMAAMAVVPLRAQRSATPFRSGVNAVYLDVTVLAPDGGIVTGLTRDDFEIYDEGVKHDVDVFSDEPSPISVGVLIDASTSMTGERIKAALVAAAAVGRALEPRDLWSISIFNNVRHQLIGWRPYDDSVLQGLSGITAYGGTELFRAVADMVGFMRTTPHRKVAMLVITDGADNSVVAARRQRSRLSPGVAGVGELPSIPNDSSHAIAALRTGEVLLYGLGLNWPSQAGPPHLPSLQRLAEPTGGAAVLAGTLAEVERAAARLADELRQQYTLGFYPQKAPDGKYRRLKVVTKNPTYRVRTRAGYLATRPKQP